MRLIDANTAEKNLAELVKLYEKRMPKWSPNDMLTSGRDAALKWGFIADGAEKALEIIKDMPTVDAVPVKHGHWIVADDGVTRCSICYGASDYERSFCGDCGAKMGGEKPLGPVML